MIGCDALPKGFRRWADLAVAISVGTTHQIRALQTVARGRKWPIAAVEITDVSNHVNCTGRQSQPQWAA
jgi:hypothetical protein